FLQPLLDALAAEQMPIRQSAIDTLAALPAARVQEALLGIAQDKSMVALRRQAAVETMGRLATKESVASLLKLIRSDSPGVGQASASALQEISGQDYGADIGQWQKWWQAYETMVETDWQASRLRFFADRSRRLRDELDQAETTLLQLHKELLDKVVQTDLANT